MRCAMDNQYRLPTHIENRDQGIWCIHHGYLHPGDIASIKRWDKKAYSYRCRKCININAKLKRQKNKAEGRITPAEANRTHYYYSRMTIRELEKHLENSKRRLSIIEEILSNKKGCSA